MELEKLFLKKEELPIIHETGFQVPIHPKLLDENISIDQDIAHDIFPKVAEDWYNDLTKYVEKENSKNKDWIKEVYLKHKPKIDKRISFQVMNNIWEDGVRLENNGFASGFSIIRNGGGSIYFYEDDSCCYSFGKTYIKFSDEKIKEFEYKKIGNHSKLLTYAQHNVDHYPGALFLRNWAIMYMNEVFKEVF